jgi:hypothetical protein
VVAVVDLVYQLKADTAADCRAILAMVTTQVSAELRLQEALLLADLLWVYQEVLFKAEEVADGPLAAEADTTAVVEEVP